MNTTNAARNANDMIALIDAYAEARHRKGHSTYNAEVAALRECVVAALASTAAALPAGRVMVPESATTEIVCAIEREIDEQVTASGMSGVMHRQDGYEVWSAALAAAPKAEPARPAGEYPALPKSYMGSVVTNGIRDGCKVTFRFSSVAEADAWHDSVTSSKADRAMRAQAAPAAQGDAEDAARYRWLRSGVRERQGIPVSGHRTISSSSLRAMMEFDFWCAPDELDAAIDAARSQAKEGEAA